MSRRYLSVSRLGTPERIAAAAGCVIVASLLLPWFSTSGLGRIAGRTGVFTATQVFGWPMIAYLGWCAAVSALGPWVMARGHALSWTPGELTMLFGLAGFALVLLNGFVLDRPGYPATLTRLEIGYPVALLGLLGLAFAGFLKTTETPKARRPPGAASSKQA